MFFSLNITQISMAEESFFYRSQLKLLQKNLIHLHEPPASKIT